MKKGFNIFLAIVALFLIWYFFVKKSDFTINFKSNSFPETVNQSIKLWNNGLDNSLGLEEIGDLNHLQQTLKVSDSVHVYEWQITAITDSTSSISVGITDKNLKNSLFNRLTVPFIQTNFIKGAENRIYNFMTILKDHVDNFKVTVVGVEEIPEKYLAYIPVEKSQIEKAKGMMENSSFIGQLLTENQIQLDGPPMLEVTYWNRKTDSLVYNFGYPILPNQNVPLHTEVEYKKLSNRKGIKAIYNGNYITSDRAWYALLKYAEKNNIAVKALPIEIFYNNPDMGGNALSWKTEVYLPVVNNE
jgi:effector-binding domain-containing protein